MPAMSSNPQAALLAPSSVRTQVSQTVGYTLSLLDKQEITDISADTEEPTKVVEDVIDQYMIEEGVGQVAIEVLDAKEAEMLSHGRQYDIVSVFLLM